MVCDYACNSTEVFRAIEAQFWTWSPAVYAKLEAGIHVTLWGSADRDATVADEKFTMRVRMCLALMHQHDQVHNMFRLPLEALIALVLYSIPSCFLGSCMGSDDVCVVAPVCVMCTCTTPAGWARAEQRVRAHVSRDFHV